MVLLGGCQIHRKRTESLGEGRRGSGSAPFGYYGRRINEGKKIVDGFSKDLATSGLYFQFKPGKERAWKPFPTV